MKESVIQHRIIRYLKGLGAYTTKTIIGNKSGIPDITACFRGWYIAIEVKTHTNKATKLQMYNIKGIKEAGGIAFVARSVEDVTTNLQLNGIL